MAMIAAEGKRLPVKLLQNLDVTDNYEENINNSIQNLEYLFTSGIQKVLSGEHPRIGFTEGNGELSDLQLHDAIKSLSESYEVRRVNLDVIDKEGLDKLKALFVTKPQKEFTEAQIQMAPWVYYPLLMPDSSSYIVKNIDNIRSEFTSTVDTIDVKGISKKTILHTSAFNKVFNAPQMLSLQMVAEQPDPRDYASVPRAVGVLLEGSFPSVFAHRSLPAGIDQDYQVPETSKPTKMIVIG